MDIDFIENYRDDRIVDLDALVADAEAELELQADKSVRWLGDGVSRNAGEVS